MLLVLLLNALLVQGHKCVHEHAQSGMKVTTSPQMYANHPLEQAQDSRRRLYNGFNRYKEEAKWRPIRILVSYDAMDEARLTKVDAEGNRQTVAPSAEMKENVQRLVTAAVDYYMSFLTVVPVVGPLRMSASSWCDALPITKKFTGFYWERNEIQGMQPEAMEPESNPGGVKDADLVLGVTISDTGSCVDTSSTLAFAKYCSTDQHGRPIAGSVTFCKKAVSDTGDWVKAVTTTLHEIGHVLFMSSSLFGNYRDPSTGERYAKPTVTDDAGVTWLATPKVLAEAQAHYGCRDGSVMRGGQIENNGGGGTAGSHWEMQTVRDEFMTGQMHSDRLKISRLSLAAMEDSGWYRVADWEVAGNWKYGKDAGCGFFDPLKCPTPAMDPSVCAEGGGDVCGVNNRGFGYCRLNQLAGCSYLSSYRYGNGPLTEDCTFPWTRDSWTGPFKALRGKLNSRCAVVSTSQGGRDTRCALYECRFFDPNKGGHQSAKISVPGYYSNDPAVYSAVCTRPQGLKGEWVAAKADSARPSSTVQVQCPRLDRVCGSRRWDFCDYGFWSDKKDACVCRPGYKGEQCRKQHGLRRIDRIEFASDFSRNDPGLTVQGSSDDAINGEWQNLGPFQPDASKPAVWNYYKRGDLFMFFDAHYPAWIINTEISASGPKRYCFTYRKSAHPIECNGEWLVSRNNYDKGMKVVA